MRACECCLYVCMPRTPSSGNTTSRRNNPFRCHPCQKKKTISFLRDEKFPFPGVSFPLPPECFGRLPPGTSRILCEGRKVAPSGHTRFRWRRPSYPCQLPVIKRIPASNHSRWNKKGGLYFEDNHDLWNPFRISGNSWLTKWLTILVPPGE